MDKTTIEVLRIPNHWAGYGYMVSSEKRSDEDILIEWSKKPENLSKRIYSHQRRLEEENHRRVTEGEYAKDQELYKRKDWLKELCDYVIYLDIYHQEEFTLQKG